MANVPCPGSSIGGTASCPPASTTAVLGLAQRRTHTHQSAIRQRGGTRVAKPGIRLAIPRAVHGGIGRTHRIHVPGHDLEILDLHESTFGDGAAGVRQAAGPSMHSFSRPTVLTH